VRVGDEGEEMSDRSSGIGARLLILCWLIAIIGGFFVSLVMSLLAFRDGTTMSGIVLGAIAIGCAALCFRTYVSRDDLRT
jgi:ABC-type enterobactin transport system permease subunit